MRTTARGELRPAFAGAAATFSGIGLSRFAYVPLFPAMVAAGWITGAEGGLLGAVNLAGYLAGVLGGRALAQRTGTPAALDIGMAAAAIACLACAWNGGLGWLAAWRLVAGIAGGILMGLTGPAVQGAVPAARRGTAGGIVIGGVASGIVAVAILVPLALPLGPGVAWAGFGLLILALWAAARPLWPTGPIVLLGAGPVPGAATLTLAYGISGAGFVPHMVYFADLAVRGRGLEPGYGALVWLLFGLGGIAGTLSGGRAADRWGGSLSLRIWLAIQVAGLAASLGPGVASLWVSALLGGFSAVGISAVALARAREIAGASAGAIWVRATAAFAVAQAATGFALAALFRGTGSHDAVFSAGLALSVAALLVALIGARRAEA